MLYFYCMKKNFIFIFTLLSVLFSILIISCAGSPQSEEEEVLPPVIAEAEEPEAIEVVEEVELDEDDSVVILDQDEDDNEEEYLRSIADLDEPAAVSKKEFTDDKREILEIISELAIIMETKNTLSWLNFIDEESKEYYKNPVNLRKVQRKLPNKLIELKTIEDYFKFVFIPARKNSQIDEIRYISKTHVKAVQLREDMPDAIYYEFRKENNKWLIYIPPVS